MLDDIREWISDNLRYLMLGAALILLILVIGLVVRLIGGSRSSSNSSNTTTASNTASDADDAQIGEAVTEAQDVSQTADVSSVVTKDLVKNDAAVLTLIQQYYTAVAAGDTVTLASIVEPWDSTVQEKILSTDIIEAYQNIATYSKEGVNSGEYVVFAYYEAKVTDIETLVPSLSMLYLIPGTGGSLVIDSDRESDSQIAAYTAEAASGSDVTALISEVNAKYQEALDSDEALGSYIASMDTSSSDTDTVSDDEEAGDTSVQETAAVGEQMTTITTLNIRQTPSTSAAIMGVLPEGTSITVLSEADGGWVQIEYEASGSVIQGYVMLEYLTA